MTSDDVRRLAQQTFDQHPDLRREDQAEELLRRTIWRINQVGHAGRQRNPSGLLSKDKLAVTLADGDHAYDLYGLQTPLTFAFGEVFPANLVPDDGIAETGGSTMPPTPPGPGQGSVPSGPIVDLSGVLSRLDSLTSRLGYLEALAMNGDQANERRYVDVVAHATALGEQVKQLQFDGRIPYLGTITLKVKP